MEALPQEVLEHIASFVSTNDLGRLQRVCKKLQSAIVHSRALWKRHCRTVWLCDKLEDDCSSWREQWIKYVRQYGRYKDCFAKIKMAWNLIEEFITSLAKKHPEGLDPRLDISKALKEGDGLSEVEISSAEEKLGVSFPDAYRCALRIHNGQNLEIIPTFLGGLKFYTFEAYLQFYPLHFMVTLNKPNTASLALYPFGANKQYLEIVGSLKRNCFYLLALDDCKYTPPGHVIQASVVAWKRLGIQDSLLEVDHSNIIPDCSVGLVGEAHGGGEPDNRLLDTLSFSDWMLEQAKCIRSCPVVDNIHIMRFKNHPDSVATTGHFTVEVGVAIDPSFGMWNAQYVLREIDIPSTIQQMLKGASYSYWISIKMNDEAPQKDSCQLLRRHWSIYYSDGRSEAVDGEGVIGEQPTFTPGYHHQYSSCTMFDNEEYCEMEGFFLMKYLDRDETFHVTVPRFHMSHPQVQWL